MLKELVVGEAGLWSIVDQQLDKVESALGVVLNNPAQREGDNSETSQL
jgi:hypothetical protein